MPLLEVNREQVLALVRQLPAEDQQQLLLTLAEEAAGRRAARRGKAEQVARRLSAERGLDWDTMSDEERLAFIDDLVHEDRSCA